MLIQEVGFATAEENMHYDAQIKDPLFRLYEWQNRGITLGYKQQIPADLQRVCHAKRPTGGGIVFHCPHDWVFAIYTPINSKKANPLKEKMGLVADLLHEIAIDSGMNWTQAAHQSPENILFCNSYYNPYERYMGPEKVLGLTMRRYKHHCLIQGIIYMQDQAHYFKDFPNYRHVFSRGIYHQMPQLDINRWRTKLIHRFESIPQI